MWWLFVETMLIVFDRDISLILQSWNISTQNSSHDLLIVIIDSLVLVIMFGTVLPFHYFDKWTIYLINDYGGVEELHCFRNMACILHCLYQWKVYFVWLNVNKVYLYLTYVVPKSITVTPNIISKIITHLEQFYPHICNNDNDNDNNNDIFIIFCIFTVSEYIEIKYIVKFSRNTVTVLY